MYSTYPLSSAYSTCISFLSLHENRWGRYCCYPHFIEGETEAQEDAWHSLGHRAGECQSSAWTQAIWLQNTFLTTKLYCLSGEDGNCKHFILRFCSFCQKSSSHLNQKWVHFLATVFETTLFSPHTTDEDAETGWVWALPGAQVFGSLLSSFSTHHAVDLCHFSSRGWIRPLLGHWAPFSDLAGCWQRGSREHSFPISETGVSGPQSTGLIWAFPEEWTQSCWSVEAPLTRHLDSNKPFQATWGGSLLICPQLYLFVLKPNKQSHHSGRVRSKLGNHYQRNNLIGNNSRWVIMTSKGIRWVAAALEEGLFTCKRDHLTALSLII